MVCFVKETPPPNMLPCFSQLLTAPCKYGPGCVDTIPPCRCTVHTTWHLPCMAWQWGSPWPRMLAERMLLEGLGLSSHAFPSAERRTQPGSRQSQKTEKHRTRSDSRPMETRATKRLALAIRASCLRGLQGKNNSMDCPLLK